MLFLTMKTQEVEEKKKILLPQVEQVKLLKNLTHPF
jgi:hypothetical protein